MCAHPLLICDVAMSEVPVSPFSTTTLENARKAKVTLENFYENLLIQDRDRSNRFVGEDRPASQCAVPVTFSLTLVQVEETRTVHGRNGTFC